MTLIIVTKLYEVKADALKMNQELQNLKITITTNENSSGSADNWKQTLGSKI